MSENSSKQHTTGPLADVLKDWCAIKGLQKDLSVKIFSTPNAMCKHLLRGGTKISPFLFQRKSIPLYCYQEQSMSTA